MLVGEFALEQNSIDLWAPGVPAVGCPVLDSRLTVEGHGGTGKQVSSVKRDLQPVSKETYKRE